VDAKVDTTANAEPKQAVFLAAPALGKGLNTRDPGMAAFLLAVPGG
jgi:hypothetical protein